VENHQEQEMVGALSDRSDRARGFAGCIPFGSIFSSAGWHCSILYWTACMEILSVSLAFLKIGIVAFGGGWSTVGLIKHEIVPRWMNAEAFNSLIAIAQ
jgi:hypothetical protein